MIDRIIIDNFATIESLSFDPGDAFNVITGETGAGKSVLVTAISTVLGDRADTSMVRTGADKAFIQIAGTKNGEEVIVSREILASGKSVSKLNGEMVTLSQLRAFCSDWVDIHGQYDNQQILDPDNHIHINDRYHGDTILPELEKLQLLYTDYKHAQKEYDDLLKAESTAKEQQDYYNYEFNYIDSLGLVPGEDEELRDKLSLIKNSANIYSAVHNSYEMLYGMEESVLSALGRISSELSTVESYSDSIASMTAETNEAYYSLQDIAERLRDMQDSLNFSEADMDMISERLSAIEDAKRKYNKNIDEIIAYRDELASKLELIQNFDAEKTRLSGIAQSKYEALENQASHVSDIRHIIASSLQTAMERELSDLEFANSEFRIDIQRSDEIGPYGFDKVEFLISTNPGEPLMPLTKIASGGEISRIMLAFKHIIGESDSVETMIFDEIDTGISGRTALVVGRKLSEIAAHRQILSVTHLPQIAAYGDDNFLITKSIDDEKAFTDINHLDAEGKVRMIATLFSGSDDGEGAIEAARELIQSSK